VFDAFSDRYLHPKLCPFIWNVRKNIFFSKISPLFAYEGIKNCLETGISINKHRVWNDHVFSKFGLQNGFRHKLFKKLLRFVDRASPTDEWNKILRYALFKLNRIDYGIPHLIPACLIDFFPVIKKAHNWKNLYEILREYNVKYRRIEPKVSILELEIIKTIPKLLNHHDALFIKLNSLDRLAHKYGPLSDAVKNRIKYFDGLLRGSVKALDKNVTMIIMSDHGMVPVMGHVDLISFLRDKGFKFNSHYMGFIGATYASFWFKNEKTKDGIKNELSALGEGRSLSLDDKKALGIDCIGWEYGEEIFAVKEHYAIFPEFYHRREPPKGMHGYAFGKYDAPIFLMHTDASIKSRKDKINFIDVMPTILRTLGLPAPSYVEGKSLI